MKKSILFITLAFVQLFSFGQEKHITFADSFLVNTGSNLDYFKVAESANYDGYFLASKFDDGSNMMKHYIAKTNFKNDIIWDSVYWFQEPFTPWAHPVTSVVSVDNEFIVATQAAATNGNNNSQPFIYNLDNNGGLNWNKYFEIDTVDFGQTRVLNTNDGGYMLFGHASDFSGNSLSSEYGFAYKLDPAGALEWSKFYADKDTSEFRFSEGAATDDDKFIFAGNARNEKSGGGKPAGPTNMDHFMNVVCVDLNGDVVWNSALIFDPPVDNMSPFEIRSVNIVDAQTVLVSFKFYNGTTFYNDFGLASINTDNGDVNWVKAYSIDAESSNFELRKAVTKKDGHLVVFYDDYGNDSKSDLLELDHQGNIIQSKTIQEYAGSNTYYHDVIATEDGGVYINANISAGTGLLNFKMDKNLNTHCPEEYTFITPTTYPLVYDVYTLVDTVMDVMPFEGTLTLMSEPEISASTDLYCSCELSINGSITVPGAGLPADSVLVSLYRFDPFPGQFILHDTITTDAVGSYHFDFLPSGDYVIKAEPSVTKYPDMLNTYYNSVSSHHQWDSAEVVMMDCSFNPITYNFDLIQSLPQTGGWTCNGYVFEYFGYIGAKLAPGDPIPDIDITVEQSPGGAINSTTTDVNGYYQFTGLDNSATFIVRADIPGLPNDSIYTFAVTPGDPALDSLNFYVDTVGVYILEDDITTNVVGINNNLLGINLMPNPTKGMISLSIDTNDPLNVGVYITNVIGEEIYSNTYRAKSGKTNYPIDLTSYSEGIYFVRITQGDSYVIKKIIKQ